MKYFRADNTEGYSADDLAALNQAISYIIEASEPIMDKSAIDHAIAALLFAYDRGLRNWALIEAGEPDWPFPPSYHTPKGPAL